MATERETVTGTGPQDVGVDSQVETIQEALIEAENSSEPQPFDAEAFKRRMQRVHG